MSTFGGTRDRARRNRSRVELLEAEELDPLDVVLRHLLAPLLVEGGHRCDDHRAVELTVGGGEALDEGDAASGCEAVDERASGDDRHAGEGGDDLVGALAVDRVVGVEGAFQRGPLRRSRLPDGSVDLVQRLLEVGGPGQSTSAAVCPAGSVASGRRSARPAPKRSLSVAGFALGGGDARPPSCRHASTLVALGDVDRLVRQQRAARLVRGSNVAGSRSMRRPDDSPDARFDDVRAADSSSMWTVSPPRSMPSAVATSANTRSTATASTWSPRPRSERDRCALDADSCRVAPPIGR